jgi:hypothetical protein
MEELYRWLNKTLSKLSRKSDTAAAIRYALSRWPTQTRYLADGRIEIDNSAAEGALRAVALGRKNFLLCGSDAGVVPDQENRCTAFIVEQQLALIFDAPFIQCPPEPILTLKFAEPLLKVCSSVDVPHKVCAV